MKQEHIFPFTERPRHGSRLLKFRKIYLKDHNLTKARNYSIFVFPTNYLSMRIFRSCSIKRNILKVTHWQRIFASLHKQCHWLKIPTVEIKHSHRIKVKKIVSTCFLTETVKHFRVLLVSSHVLYCICKGVSKLRKPAMHTTQTNIL